MDDMLLPGVQDIVYLVKGVGPLRRGTEVIVREVSPNPADAYPLVVESTPTLLNHHVWLDIPLALGEWSDTPVPAGDGQHVSIRGGRYNHEAR